MSFKKFKVHKASLILLDKLFPMFNLSKINIKINTAQVRVMAGLLQLHTLTINF